MNENKLATIQQRMAIRRTIMANERTFLSYLRTSFALLVAGLSFMYLTEDFILICIGISFLPLALFTFIIGIIRFKKIKNSIRKEEDEIKM